MGQGAHLVLCDDREGEMGMVLERLKKEEIHVYSWWVRTAMQQEPTQHCKAIILQLKIKILKKER